MSTCIWDRETYIQLRENVTLLERLSKEPERPTENPLPQLSSQPQEPVRQLTFQRERDLVDNLAFISASSDDAIRVVAVCIEERSDGEGSSIRVAINAGNISKFTDGLKRIARTLERVALRVHKSDQDENALLKNIIELNRGRILSRLRSKHAKRTLKILNKGPIVERFAKAVSTGFARKSNTLVSEGRRAEIEANVQGLQTAFRQLEAMSRTEARSGSADQVLADLVKRACSLALIDDLETLLNEIPGNQGFDPMTGSTLRQSIGKLGRYHSACLFLIVAARKLAIFKKIQVDGVNLQQTASFSCLSSQKKDQPTQTHVAQPEIVPIEEVVALHPPFALLNDDVKVHAEIQLIFFYELHPAEIPPRVICSGKSACFLCNLFVKLHGRFYMARTHGVLYKAWALPNITASLISQAREKELALTVRQFNRTLKATIETVRQGQNMRRYHPNESVLNQPPEWTPVSTLLSTNTSVQAPGSVTHLIEQSSAPHNLINIVDTLRAPSPAILSQTNNRIRELQYDEVHTQTLTSLPTLETPVAGEKMTNELGQRSLVGVQLHIPLPVDRTLSPSTSFVEKSTPPPNPLPQNILETKTRVSDLEIDRDQDNLIHRNDDDNTSGSVLSLRTPNSTSDPMGYEILIRGESVKRELRPARPFVRLSTKYIHLTLLLEMFERASHEVIPASASRSEDFPIPSEGYGVIVKWLDRSEEAIRCDGGANVVSLNSLKESLEETLIHGAARSLSSLYIVHKSDVISIKYTTLTGLSN
ncbi:MAG: hypothetical protein M1824_005893 [Vezdaea acicularis]|nr:MAG: hypothetical protein M1824_005893 [Vezdaea acicularis]